MTESSGFFTTTPETFYTEEQFSRYNNALQTNGVIPAALTNDGFDAEDKLEVIEAFIPAMEVYVKPGHCMIQGYWGYNDAYKGSAISSNTSGNPRIDRIVERLDKTANTVSLALITGTPGVTPSAPALTRTSTIWEISLAQIEVANGATSITNSDITDERGDPAVCGYATAAYYINEDLNMRGHKAINLADPTTAQDAATKAYVDAEVAGFSITDVLINADKNWNNKSITNLKTLVVNSVKATASDTLRYSDDPEVFDGGDQYIVAKSVSVPSEYARRGRPSSLRIKFSLRGGTDGVAYAYIDIPAAGIQGTLRSSTSTSLVEYSHDLSGIAGDDKILIYIRYTGTYGAKISNFRIYATDSATTETIGSSGTISWP